jgi:hypothetical protein
MLPYQTAKVAAYSALLVDSFRRVTGRSFLPDAPDLAAALWQHPPPLVSHGTQDDPVFCYANAAALRLWQMGWDDFIRLPSRQSAEAEPGIQSDRAALLAKALAAGHVADYRGIRISAKGQRFEISETILWNVTDAAGLRHGQAALIGAVAMLA